MGDWRGYNGRHWEPQQANGLAIANQSPNNGLYTTQLCNGADSFVVSDYQNHGPNFYHASFNTYIEISKTDRYKCRIVP